MKVPFSTASNKVSSPYKRIPTSQLRPGMFLVRVLGSWWKSPFFLHRRTLQDEQEIQQLIQSGIQFVEIDPSQEREIEIADSGQVRHPPEGDPKSLSKYHDSCVSHGHGASISKAETWARAIRLREEMSGVLRDMFEGLKTGNLIPMTAVYQVGESLIREVSEHPVVMTELILLDNLERYDKTIHSHVLDVAILSLLVGLQLDLPRALLEDVVIAGLLHDVGFVRLPMNLVRDQWADADGARPLIRQHVNVGVALIKQHINRFSLVPRIVGEHHEYLNGTGFPRGLMEDALSQGGKLLGLVDYFDELTSVWGNPHKVPPALALRGIFKEVHDGRFPKLMGEALVKTVGVYPVGTVLKLSSGEMAVVASHQAQAGVRPVVWVIAGEEGHPLSVPREVDLGSATDAGRSVSIQQILQPDAVSVDWKALATRPGQGRG